MDPYMPSERLKLALQYSNTWNPVKMTAKIIVKTRPQTAPILSPAVIAWCEYVIVAPEQSKIKVLRRGTSKALKTSIPLGGQIVPISTGGHKQAAKKAQKNAKKNITSDTINTIIP